MQENISKIEELTNPKLVFGHCYEVGLISPGGTLPVGGDVLNDSLDKSFIADLDKFDGFFDEVKNIVSQYNLPELRKWLDRLDSDIDEAVFAHLFAFTQIYNKRYPRAENSSTIRVGIYKQGEVKLSEVMGLNAAECAEISALAQSYLQTVGVPSSYFSGEVLWEKNHEFAEDHSFVIIRPGSDDELIFDPTNPTQNGENVFPSIYIPTTNFSEAIRSGGKKFVASRNVISGKKAYFGVGDHTNIDPEKDIV